ncbi:uroporphyrinogen-III C-methyltransferase [Thauera linaloolentis]|uniref:uroporphyrinogen-III C-methyltransferase n=1 Tax=Thauera linaloolentis (strain DSM 12138 / JCM 21573 / CCUG 41526 / CIP 105981 / IAM 15112 / NBRC 102519 / 47Lol) TaxID=1123367 RepID=N6YSB8_THAL4|nr:uroporphyrinogen-III C-methyltransferase [Thauera linaloolentis]ENO85267.1 uroporphyrin-III C-methyltransferase [Thauera linaloolentis 47Lol = DSM 12138]MCM8564966.1 uroporphyrinogen-III C-methyltransferase [Thauera linaloolentis]
MEGERDISRRGCVYLVGAGPGDPELLTLKAARLIESAEAVVYDHLVGKSILKLIPAAARRVYAGKEAGNHALPQHEINQLLVALAREGLRVVRLKGGDPFIFGRGGEEMQALQAAGLRCEVVPGITAAAGAGAAVGIPLTHREHAQTLVFATGHLKDDTVDLDWEALARPNQTVVIYMGLGALDIICRELLAHGLPAGTPAAVIHGATTPGQRGVYSSIGTLPAAVSEAGLRPPALIVIGDVVAIGEAAAQAACTLAGQGMGPVQ